MIIVISITRPFILVPALPQKETLAFALQENDPVVKAINLVMLGMRHDGSLKRLEQKWLHVANRCSKPTATGEFPSHGRGHTRAKEAS